MPTSAPPSGAAGDVVAVSAFSASATIAYDDDDRTLFVAQGRGFSAGGNPSAITLPAGDSSPYITAAAYSSAGRALYFAGFSTIYRATIAGAITTVAGGFGRISGIAVDPTGAVYVVDGDHVAAISGGSVRSITPPGTLNTTAPGITLGTPQIAFDTRDGALYVTDPFDTAVKRVTTSGSVTTVAGTCVAYSGGGQQSCWPGMRGGTGTSARFGSPSGIAYDATADLFYISDAYDNVVWVMTPGGTSAIVAGYGAFGSRDGNGRRALIFAPVGLALSSGGGLLYINQVDQFAGRSLVSSYATSGGLSTPYTFPALEFPTPSTPSQPQGLAGSPDGSAWITEGYAGKVAHVTPSGITEFALPPGFNSPYKIAVDASGAAWTTANTFTGPGIINGAAVIRIRSDGSETPYSFGPQFPGPVIDTMATGPDGNPWFGSYAFAAPGTASIKTIDRTTGTVTDHPLSTARVRALSAGPDGNIWFATSVGSSNTLNRLATDGHIVGQPFTISHPAIDMAANPVDHTLWYVDGSTTLGRVDVTGSEADTPLCSACGAAPDPVGVAVAPDGTIWFTEDNPSNIAHRDANGVVTRYPLPAPNAGPSQIAVRADGKVWVATIFGTVFLFDAAAYDALGMPHMLANASVKRSPQAVDRRALYGAASVRATSSSWRPAKL